MTNLVKSRCMISIDPKCGRYDTKKVENMVHIIVQCPETKNMKMKCHQKVCEVMKEAVTPRKVNAVELYENQEFGRFWGLEGKIRPDFILVVDEGWAEW